MRILPVLQIFRVSIPGTFLPVLSGFGTAHTLITLSIWAFSALAIFRPPVLHYSQYSDLSVKPSCYPEHQETFILGSIYCVRCTLLSRSQSIMAQPRPRAIFLCLCSRRIHLIDRRESCVQFIVNIHSPVPYFALLVLYLSMY